MSVGEPEKGDPETRDEGQKGPETRKGEGKGDRGLIS